MLVLYFVYYFIACIYSATWDAWYRNCFLPFAFRFSERCLKYSIGYLPFLIPFLFLPWCNLWHSLHNIIRVIIWVIRSLYLNTLFELITIGTNCAVADIFTMDPAKLPSPPGFLIFSACGLWIMCSEHAFWCRWNKNFILSLTAFKELAQKWEMLSCWKSLGLQELRLWHRMMSTQALARGVQYMPLPAPLLKLQSGNQSCNQPLIMPFAVAMHWRRTVSASSP